MALKKTETLPSIEQLQTTEKVRKLKGGVRDDNELAKLINLSKGTMYTRINKHNWKISEMFYIDHLTNRD